MVSLKLPKLIIFGGLNEWGDFLAGLFGPMAFAWLIVGYHLQRTELKQNTEALKAQAEELRGTLDQHKKMVELETQTLYSTFLPVFVFKCNKRSESGRDESCDVIYSSLITFENIGHAALSADFVKFEATYKGHLIPDTVVNLKQARIETPIMGGECVKCTVLDGYGQPPISIQLVIRAPTVIGRTQETTIELVHGAEPGNYYCKSQCSHLLDLDSDLKPAL